MISNPERAVTHFAGTMPSISRLHNTHKSKYQVNLLVVENSNKLIHFYGLMVIPANN